MIPSVTTLGILFCSSYLFLHAEAEFLKAASLGKAPVGIYSRHGGPFGDSTYLASLGGAPVGAYLRQQIPALMHPLARVPVVSKFPVDHRPVRPRPRPPVKPRPIPAKPKGVSGRILGGLLKGLVKGG